MQLSLERLASQVRVDRSYLSLVERGLRFPSDQLTRRLADALGMNHEDLTRSVHADRVAAKFGGQQDLLKAALLRLEAGSPVTSSRKSSAYEELMRAAKKK